MTRAGRAVDRPSRRGRHRNRLGRRHRVPDPDRRLPRGCVPGRSVARRDEPRPVVAAGAHDRGGARGDRARRAPRLVDRRPGHRVAAPAHDGRRLGPRRPVGSMSTCRPRQAPTRSAASARRSARCSASLARSQAEQRRLVQDAGHELKTPLTSIRTNLDVLRRHPDLKGAERAQVVGDLHAEVEEMVELVEEIVAVAGGVASDEPATVFSLGDAVADVVDRYQRRTGRTIRLDADESPGARPADRRATGDLQPRRQRDQVRPVGRPHRGDRAAGTRRRARSRTRASRRTMRRWCSNGSTGEPRPARCPARDSGCRSCATSSSATAGPCTPRTGTAAGRSSASCSPSSPERWQGPGQFLTVLLPRPVGFSRRQRIVARDTQSRFTPRTGELRKDHETDETTTTPCADEPDCSAAGPPGCSCSARQLVNAAGPLADVFTQARRRPSRRRRRGHRRRRDGGHDRGHRPRDR